MAKTSITARELRGRLFYEAETGVFRFIRKPRTGIASTRDWAGSIDAHGYVVIELDGEPYKAHRLAWIYMTGAWPACEIDHRDGLPANNAWANLREATHSQNGANRKRPSSNSSGYKGASWHKASAKWRANIYVDGGQKHLGLFDTAEEAHCAYVSAAEEHFGEFARAT